MPPARPIRAAKTLAALALALIALALPAGAQPGPADPVPQAVGRVNVAGYSASGMCSGVLIAPDSVLTAAHCLYAGRGSRLAQPGQVHFVAGWERGDSYGGHSTARAIWRAPAVPPHRTAPGSYRDLAVLRLAIPIGNVAPLPIGRWRPADGPLWLLGYRRSAAHRAGRSGPCAVIAASDALMRLDCAGEPGLSGGPVVAERADGPVVVAIVSAGSGSGAGASVLAVHAQPLPGPGG